MKKPCLFYFKTDSRSETQVETQEVKVVPRLMDRVDGNVKGELIIFLFILYIKLENSVKIFLGIIQ